MTWLKNAWESAQKRFAIVFTIGAALSFANALSSIRFVIDAFEWLIQQAQNAPGLDQVLQIAAAAISAILEWWRQNLRMLFAWFNLNPPAWLLDLGSAVSFIVGRAIFRRATLKREVAALAALHEKSLLEEERLAALDAQRAAPGERVRRRARYSPIVVQDIDRALHRLPFEVAATVGLLVAFFVALYAVDAWYVSR